MCQSESKVCSSRFTVRRVGWRRYELRLKHSSPVKWAAVNFARGKHHCALIALTPRGLARASDISGAFNSSQFIQQFSSPDQYGTLPEWSSAQNPCRNGPRATIPVAVSGFFSMTSHQDLSLPKKLRVPTLWIRSKWTRIPRPSTETAEPNARNLKLHLRRRPQRRRRMELRSQNSTHGRQNKSTLYYICAIKTQRPSNTLPGSVGKKAASRAWAYSGQGSKLALIVWLASL